MAARVQPSWRTNSNRCRAAAGVQRHVFEEMDVDAILARKPEVVLIDELAHTNIEGTSHAKRFRTCCRFWRRRSMCSPR